MKGNVTVMKFAYGLMYSSTKAATETKNKIQFNADDFFSMRWNFGEDKGRRQNRKYSGKESVQTTQLTVYPLVWTSHVYAIGYVKRFLVFCCHS